MIYGDEVEIVRGGPRIASKSVQPLGISDGSECWGVWAPSQSRQIRRQYPMSAKEERDQKQPTSLLISPFHPSLWPVLVHVELCLFNYPGMIARAAHLLSKHKINILFDEHIKAGYQYSIWHVVGFVESLKTEVKKVVAMAFSRFARDTWLRDWTEQGNIVTKMKESKETIIKELKDSLRALFRDNNIRDVGQFDRIIENFTTLASLGASNPGDWQKFEDFAAETLLEELPDDLWGYGDQSGGSDTNTIGSNPNIPFHLTGKRGVLYEVGHRMLTFLNVLEADLSSAWLSELLQKHTGDLDDLDRPRESNFLYTKHGPCEMRRPEGEIPRVFRTPWSWYWSDLPALALKPSEAHVEWQRLSDILKGEKGNLAERIFARHDWASVRCKGLPRMASYWAFGRTSRPIRFIYRAAKAHFEPENRDSFAEALRETGHDPSDISERALAYFDRHEYCIRLFLLEKQRVSKNMLEIDVPYHAAKGVPNKSSHCKNVQVEANGEKRNLGEGKDGLASSSNSSDHSHPSSRGLLQTVCERLCDPHLDLDLLRLSNRLTHWRPHEEGGTIHILAESEKRNAKEIIGETLSAIEAAVVEVNEHNRDKGWRLTARGATVRPYRHVRVFMSRPIEFPRLEDCRRILDTIAMDNGIELIWAEASDKNVTETIRAEIAECGAFIQLVTLRASEHEALISGRQVLPDFAWLHYELGLAHAQGMRPIRVIDKNVPINLLESYAKIDRDAPRLDFDTGSSTVELKNDLQKVIDKVIKVIYPYGQ